MTAVAALDYHRMRAPREDGQSLIAPPLADVAELFAAHEQRRASAAYAEYDLQGRTLGDVSAAARANLIGDALAHTRAYRDVRVSSSSRILLAGHQPQLFHPGVWLKNFVLSHLGTVHDAVPVNLLIDSDTVKSAAVAVPGGSPADPVVQHLPLDAPLTPVAYEERQIVDRELFGSFGERARQQLRPLVRDPLLAEYWPLATRRAAAVDQLGLCLAQARHQLEGRRGYHTLELPVSQVCQAEPFAWFAAHLLAHLPRLWETYNDSLAEYRRNNHLRSASHPVPNLAAVEGWLEAPFWIWRSDDPRRRAVYAQQLGDELRISDRAGFQLRLPLSADGEAGAAAEMLQALHHRGIKLRTRALTTTLWARLALGDVFIHGLGGAKYDQLTDALIERFFGLTPPAFLTVSGTLHLPVERPTVSDQDVRRLHRTLRELHFNPERFIDVERVPAQTQSAVRDLLATKQSWIAREPRSPAARERYLELRRLSEAIRPWVESEVRRVTAQRASLAHELRAARILASREYAFCFFPWEKMRILLLEFPPATS